MDTSRSKQTFIYKLHTISYQHRQKLTDLEHQLYLPDSGPTAVDFTHGTGRGTSPGEARQRQGRAQQ